MNKWISVLDSLPEIGRDIVALYHCPPGTFKPRVGYRCCKNGWVFGNQTAHEHIMLVSHWAYLDKFNDKMHEELREIEKMDPDLVTNVRYLKGYDK